MKAKEKTAGLRGRAKGRKEARTANRWRTDERRPGLRLGPSQLLSTLCEYGAVSTVLPRSIQEQRRRRQDIESSPSSSSSSDPPLLSALLHSRLARSWLLWRYDLNTRISPSVQQREARPRCLAGYSSSFLPVYASPRLALASPPSFRAQIVPVRAGTSLEDERESPLGLSHSQ